MFSRLLLVIALAATTLAQSPAPSRDAAGKPSVNEHEPAVVDPMDSARALMKEKKYTEAASAFRGVIDKDPSAMRAHLGLIESLLRMAKIEDAEDVAKKAVAALPNSPLIHAAYGDAEFRAGKFAEAESEYRASLKIDDTSARGWFGLGRIYEMLSMRKHAQEAYTKAHEFDPADDQIFERWMDMLPLAQRLDALKKHVGDHPIGRDADHIKLLSAAVEKKPWILVSEIKPTELKMPPYGRNLIATNEVAYDNPRHISTGYGLQVKFNDHASAVLLVDTGATGIVIGRKLAEKAAAVKIADTFISGIGDQGSVESYEAWIDKVVIGGLEFHNCIVTVSSKNDVADESGLIGPDVFRKFLVTLDFQNQKLLLSPLPKHPAGDVDFDEMPVDRYIIPEMQGFTKIYVFGHDLVIPVVVNDKAVGNFILDTGAGLNTMSQRFGIQVTKASNDHEYTMKGVSGRVSKVLTGEKAILQFGKMRVASHELPVFSNDRVSNSEGTEIAGFIGIRTLVQMKMTIDYRDGLVDFQVYDFKKATE